MTPLLVKIISLLSIAYLSIVVYTGWAKKVSYRSLHITLSNTGRFSKFFHYHILQEICNKVIITHPTSLKRDATLPCEIFIS